MQYRQVPCTYQPQYTAPTSPEATPYYGNVPGGSFLGASGWTERKGYHHRHVTSTYGIPPCCWMLFLTFHTSGFVPPTRDWPEYESNSPSPLTVFDGGYKNGFFDASWNTMVLPVSRNVRGLLGQSALCAVISPNASAHPGPGQFYVYAYFLAQASMASVSLTMVAPPPSLPSQGALAFRGPAGSFSGRISVHFWMYVGATGSNGASAQVANVNLNLRSVQVSLPSNIGVVGVANSVTYIHTQ